MIKAMTIAQTKVAYPVGTLVEVIRTGQRAKVDDYSSGSVAFIGRRTFVHLVHPDTGKSLCEVTAESIRSVVMLKSEVARMFPLGSTVRLSATTAGGKRFPNSALIATVHGRRRSDIPEAGPEWLVQVEDSDGRLMAEYAPDELTQVNR